MSIPIPMTEEFIQRVCQVIAEDQHKPIAEVTIDKTFEELEFSNEELVLLTLLTHHEYQLQNQTNKYTESEMYRLTIRTLKYLKEILRKSRARLVA